MANTALDVIRRAMLLLRVLQPGQVPQARYSSPMLDILNDIIDSANAERLTCYGDLTLSLNYTANKNQYTVGPGGDFNTPTMPDAIRQAWVRDPTSNPPQDFPKQAIFTKEEWFAVPQKALNQGAPSTYPSVIMYDRTTFPLGQLNVWPMPSNATYIQFLLFRAYLTQLAALTTAFTFPPAYLDWLKKTLAVESASLFGKAADAWLSDEWHPLGAAAAKRKLQAMNLVEAATPLAQDGPAEPMKGTYAWNIYTGGPNPPQ